MTTCPCTKRHSPPAIVVERHHVLPLSWGGPDDPSNIIEICAQTHFTVHAILNRFVHLGREATLSELGTALGHPVPAFAINVARRGWAARLPGHPTPYWLHAPGGPQ